MITWKSFMMLKSLYRMSLTRMPAYVFISDHRSCGIGVELVFPQLKFAVKSAKESAICDWNTNPLAKSVGPLEEFAVLRPTAKLGSFNFRNVL
jgi:hypothetical protein